MKNYLCINGKKTELTAEQMKQLGITKEPIAVLDGEIAKIGEYEFIVLENDGETVKLLLKGFFGEETTFGEINDFRTSTIKDVLNDFAKEIESIVGKDNLIEHTLDLTALDGLKCYGTVQSRMSLLTVAQYQKHVEKIDKYKVDNWWWLVTPWSTPKHDWKYGVACVSPVGFIDSLISDYYDSGVRPFCILKSCIFESK